MISRPLRVAPQLRVAVALPQPDGAHRVQRAPDPELHRGALDRVRERGLGVVALPHVLAHDAEARQSAADEQRGGIVSRWPSRSTGGGISRSGSSSKVGEPARPADAVEPVVNQPRVDVRDDLAGVVDGVLELEVDTRRCRRAAKLNQRLVERGAGEVGAA